MMKCRYARPQFPALKIISFSFLSLFPLAAPALAGQGAANPAGIIGVVTDNTGAVLPGVTITATSPALQVPSVTTVSDERGEYRLTPLSIGLYTVLFELPGFQSVRREGVRLTVGFVARIDTEMNVGGVAETITVSGASPLVDTTSTATSTELTSEQLEVLPTSRDGIKAFLHQVPGVRTNLEIGASGLGDGVVFRVYGQVGEPWQMLEGVLSSATEPEGSAGSHLDFNAIDGTRVQTVGSNAEMPRRGLLVDAVIKSGGNDFHGNVTFYGSGSQLEANNIDDTLKAAGIRLAKLDVIRDTNANMGGRIIRNKLWFFGGGRYEQVNREILDAFDPLGDPTGTPILNKKGAPYWFAKGSYQATEANRFTSFYHWTNDLEFRGAGRFVPLESVEDKTNPVWMTKGEWQAVRGNSLVVSVQSGRWDFSGDYWGLAPGKVSTFDIQTQLVGGNFWNNTGLRRDMGRNHTKGVVSYYKPDLWGGNHDFKVGVDHLWSWWNDGDIPAGDTPGHRAGRNHTIHRLVFNNGVPFQLVTKNSPVKPENNGQYFGVYGQDSWTIARRVTLNLGLRVEHDTAWRPEQCRVAAEFAPARCWDRVDLNSFTSLAPRLALAYDVTGDGKTVLKGGYGRFNQLRQILGDVTALNENLRSQTTWDWHDLNGNRQYDPGEVNLDPNGPDFRSITGTALGVFSPNEKQPKTDEFSLTFERELIANTAVRVTGVYSRNFNVFAKSEISRDGRYTIPITNPDPGPDGRRGTADDPGMSITYYEYPAELGGAAFARTMQVNDDALEQNFKTFEIAFTKRPSNNWQFNVSYSGTWVDIPVTCSAATGTGVGIFPSRCILDPNTTFNSANNTLEAQAKISGAYNLPYGILVSANYDIRSGAPQARQVVFTGGTTIRSITLNVEPLGTFGLPRTHLLDVRLAKSIALGGARVLELRTDLYNALNKGTVLAQNLQSGPNYLRPSRILFPRILQAGATFSF